jgi:hypothetical protein
LDGAISMARISISLSASNSDMSAVRQAIEQADLNFKDLYSDIIDTPQGRLTLVSGVPVMVSSVTAATSIYYTPYTGMNVPVYNGSNFDMIDIGAELVNVTTDATTNPAAVVASGVYDLFVWLNNGVPTLSRGPAWTSATARSAGTALTRVRGTLVNNVAITNGPPQYQGTYVGTFSANGGAANVTMQWGTVASGGGKAILNLWNMYNRITAQTRVTDSIAPYTYTLAVVRQAGGSVNNAIQYTIGMPEDCPTFYYQQNVTTAVAAGATAQISIGDNSTTAFELGGTYFAAQAAIAATGTMDVVYTKGMLETLIGQQNAYALELGDGVNANTFNVGSAGELSGILRM